MKRYKYNQRTLTIGGSITVWLNSCLTGLALTKLVNCCSFSISKAAKSTQKKQEVSRTVILPLKLAFFGTTIQDGFA